MIVYSWQGRPPYLLTKTELGRMGLRLGRHQWPVARVSPKLKYNLFDVRAAVAKRTQTAEQKVEVTELVAKADLEAPLTGVGMKGGDA